MSTSKLAIITGGSRGLGKSASLHLAKKGTDVVITYRSNRSDADSVVKELESFGVKAAALKLDVSQANTFAEFTAAFRDVLSSKFGRNDFDYLVNNAGVGAHATFMETTEAQFDDLMKIHLKGPFFLTQKLVPLLKDGGRILNVSSGLARFSLQGYAAYATMKGGIEVLTRYLAKELGPRKIAVNTIAPGAIETDFGGGAVRDNKQLNQMIASTTAMGRVGLPDDIGGAIASILSDGTNWMTAQRIEVSGGTLI